MPFVCAFFFFFFWLNGFVCAYLFESNGFSLEVEGAYHGFLLI
jgi:hypothetical protein